MIYARSDICYVGISPDHGGCGLGHARPVIAGAPAKIWALPCPQCEDYLRHDPLWASTPTTIPETVDETNAREDVEKRGSIEQAQSTADALTQLAKLGDLPAVLGKFMEFMTQGATHAVGTTPADIVATPEPSTRPALQQGEPEVPEGTKEPSFEDLPIHELRSLAKERGLRIARSKEDQITVLEEAGVAPVR